MKSALVCLFIIVGSVTCTPVQKDFEWPEWIPEWVPDLTWPPTIPSLPEFPDINIDWEAIEWPQLPDIDLGAIEWPELPELPELPEINTPVPGTPASIEDFSGLAQVEIGTGPIWVQGCGGSIITTVHILSSARCFSGVLYSDRNRRVRAGSSTRSEDGFVANVASVVIHPSFDETSITSTGDVVIVRLSAFLVFGSNIQQTSIVASGYNVPGGFSVTLAGWGSTAQGNKISDRDLYSIDLVSVENSACADFWSIVPDAISVAVTEDKICAARPETGGRDADVRDLGAPIYLDNILVGVVSYGAAVGNERFPLVATAVSSYTDWIVQNAV